MGVLGLSSDDASRGFENLTKKLEVARGELSQKVFTGKLFEAFGERAGPILAALVEQGSKAIGKLNDRIAGSDGLAASIQKAELATTTGQFKLMTSAIDGLAIEIGSQLAPAAQLAFLNLRKMANVAKAAIADQSFVAGSEDLAKATNRREALLASIKAVKAAVAGGFGSPADAFERVNEILAKTQGLARGTDVREMFGISETARVGEILAGLNRALGETHKALGRNADGSERVAKKLKIASVETDTLSEGTKKTTSELEDMAEAAKKVADELARAKEAMATGLAGSLLAPGRVSGGGGGGGGLGFGTSGELAGRQNVGFAPAPVGTTIAQRFRPENLPTETTDVEADAFREAMTRLREATAATALGMEIASSAFPALERTLADARGEVGKLAQVSEDAGGANADVVEAMRVSKASIENEIVARLKGIKGSDDFKRAMARVAEEADGLGISFEDVSRRVTAPEAAADTGAGAGTIADQAVGLFGGAGLGSNIGQKLGTAIGAAAPAIGAAAGGPIGAAVGSAAASALSEIFDALAGAFKPLAGQIGDLFAADPLVAGEMKAFSQNFSAMAAAIPGAFIVALGSVTQLGSALIALSGLAVFLTTSIVEIVGGFLLMPAIIAGLAGAFLFLLGQTETFGRITAAIGGLIKSLLMPVMEQFAGRFVFVVAIAEAIIVAFRSLLTSFSGGDLDAITLFLFEVMRGLAVKMLRATSSALKLGNAFLAVASFLLSGVSAFLLGIAAMLPAFDSKLIKLGVQAQSTAEALRAMQVNTDFFDAAIDDMEARDLEDWQIRGAELLEASEALADTFQRLSESGSNLPQFFRRAALASASEVPGLSGAPSIGGIQGGGQALQGMQITVAIDRVVTDNPLDLITQIADIAEMQAFQSTGNPIKTAAGGTNGG